MRISSSFVSLFRSSNQEPYRTPCFPFFVSTSLSFLRTGNNDYNKILGILKQIVLLYSWSELYCCGSYDSLSIDLVCKSPKVASRVDENFFPTSLHEHLFHLHWMLRLEADSHEYGYIPQTRFVGLLSITLC